jgi:hypothetical protein
MNLLDSHDTERLLWTLTPGEETTAGKELNASNLAAGKNNQRIASLIQFTLPGAPTVFYGDEVALTGDDDPDDRRTYPWADLGGSPDTDMLGHYTALAALRRDNPALTEGDLRFLLADDASGVAAYGRKTDAQAAIILVNRSDSSVAAEIPVAGYLPDGLAFQAEYSIGGGSFDSAVAGGVLSAELGPKSAHLLISESADLLAPPAPTGLHVITEGSMQLQLGWDAVPGAAGYHLYRSPLSGGGWVKLNAGPLTGTEYTDTGLLNAHTYYYVVTALDEAGNESDYSGEASGMPHLSIGWANLQWPYTINHTISATVRTENIYGQVWIDGATQLPGPTPGLIAQAGFGPEGTNPDGSPDWVWEDAAFNVDTGNNDEFKATFLPQAIGTFDYVYRYSTNNGQDWLYADRNGPIPSGALPSLPGKLTVASSGDSTPPAAPTGLMVTLASPAAIDLAWNANAEPDLAGYVVYRDGIQIAVLLGSGTTFSDTTVVENATYTYKLKAFDASLNYSGFSNEVTATAEPRTVTLNFTVTVPASTDGTGRSVYIAGTLSRLDGGLPDWDPGGVVMTRLDATHWSITLTGKEGVQIEYKYALGSWDYVEKDAACGEIGNRQLTLSYGAAGTMTINDMVENWRNVAPCGN